MNCCTRRFLITLLTALPLVALAQVRSFPPTAMRGILQITAPPVALLNDQPDRMSPGVRILSPYNMRLMSGALAGERMIVNYTRDMSGLIHEVWVLTPDEIAQPGVGVVTLRNYRFSSEIDPTPRDDGKTPFNLLPKYPQQ